MARAKAVFKPSDYPGTPDEATKRDLQEFFDFLFPGSENPEIDESHSAFAITAQNPRLALNLAKLTYYFAREVPWCQRRDLRELATQVLNLHYNCESSFRAHLASAKAAGIDAELLAAIPYWRTTPLFDEEQRLVIEYTYAVVSGNVPDELFSRVVDKYGEKGTIEFTTAVAWWAFWAMILNATRPDPTPPLRLSAKPPG